MTGGDRFWLAGKLGVAERVAYEVGRLRGVAEPVLDLMSQPGSCLAVVSTGDPERKRPLAGARERPLASVATPIHVLVAESRPDPR